MDPELKRHLKQARDMAASLALELSTVAETSTRSYYMHRKAKELHQLLDRLARAVDR